MIFFKLDMEPVAKERPRSSKIGGGHFYTPPKTAIFEAQFRFLSQKYRPDFPLEGPLFVSLWFGVVRPKNSKLRYPISRPDVDNFIKAALDAMNQIFYKDDSQISRIEAEKVFSGMPFIQVEIKPR